MSKSRYPEHLDTSVELPAVRDNIIEIGSDVINGLRSAIFQIERVLGINPQGAVGNTVADRLNSITDGNGNLLESALEQANVLSGPIIDSDIAKSAAIKESKLDLDFPTQLLQDEVAIVNQLLENITEQISDISAVLTSHVNINALNRHPATAISVTESTHSTSSTATVDLESGTVQGSLENIYNAHIHYDGSSISSSNRSHQSNQIFFDNQNINGITNADDVQEVIEDIALSTLGAQIEHQDKFHSNGILRIGKLFRTDDETEGQILVPTSNVSFNRRNGSSDKVVVISFSDPPSVGDFNIRISDVISIEDTTDTDLEFVGQYEVDKIHFSDDLTKVESLEVFGTFISDSTSLSTGRVVRNINTLTNPASLLVAAREDASLTSAMVLQICNPNAVRVITQDINPASITTLNRYFNISIDGASDIQLDTFNLDVDRQSIDSIVSRINEQVSEGHLNILAYRLDKENGQSELVIAHNIPDTSSDLHTLKINTGPDDGIISLGFAPIAGKTFSAEIGSAYYIQGQAFTGLKTKLDQAGLVYFLSGNTVEIGSLDVNFLDLDIRRGDLLVVSDASSGSDNGTYFISNVTDDQITLDTAQLPIGFANSSVSTTRFRVYENTVSLENLTFEEVDSGFGAAIVDVFLNAKQEVHYRKRIEYQAEVQGTVSLISLVDLRGNVSNLEFNLVASTGTGECINFSLDNGEIKSISGKDKYFWITSGLYNVQFRLYIQDTSLISSQISLLSSDISIDIFGLDGVNSDTNLMLSRTLYDQFKGRVAGGQQTSRALAVLQKGNLGINDIDNEAKNILSERPIDELRSDGVIYGVEVQNIDINSDGFYTFDLTRGVVYVAGKRFEIDSRETFITDIDSASIDKFYIFIDEYGNIIFDIPDAYTCGIASGSVEAVILASVERNGSTNTIFDLRLFINEIDLKILNSITVSAQSGMGHFRSLNKAIKYAKRFSEIFPNAGTPTIHLKSGRHLLTVQHDVDSTTDINDATAFAEEYRSGAWVNFPLNIEGEGDTTILDIFNSFTDVLDPTHSDKISNPPVRGRLIVACAGLSANLPSQDSNTLSRGFVRISNLRLDDTRILILDPTIRDSSLNRLNYEVILDSIVFDNSEISGFNSNNFGPRIRQIDVANGTSVGNVTISNCQFLNANIRLDQPAVDHHNINIINNTTRGRGDASGSANYLVTVDGGGNIFSLVDAPSQNNIEFRGNIHAANYLTNSNTNGPKIGPTGNIPWGDRISRALDLGTKLKTPLIEPIIPVDGVEIRAVSGTNTGSVLVQAESSATVANVSIQSSNKINIAAGTAQTSNLDISSSRDINLNATADLNISALDDLNLTIGDVSTTTVQNNISLTSTAGDIEVLAPIGDISVEATAGGLTLRSENTVGITSTGGNISLTSSVGDISIGAAGAVDALIIGDINLISGSGAITLNADDDLNIRTDSDLKLRSDGTIFISQESDTTQGATTTFVGDSTTRATVEVQGSFSVNKAGTGHASDGTVRAEHGFAVNTTFLSSFRTGIWWKTGSISNVDAGDIELLDISALTSDSGFGTYLTHTLVIDGLGVGTFGDGQAGDESAGFENGRSFYSSCSPDLGLATITFAGSSYVNSTIDYKLTIIYIPS